MERHAVSRLIGAPRATSVSTRAACSPSRSPRSPLRAVARRDREGPPDIFNILLQVMDHGTLTDNNGRQADFRNTIIIMTTQRRGRTCRKAVIGSPPKRGG